MKHIVAYDTGGTRKVYHRKSLDKKTVKELLVKEFGIDKNNAEKEFTNHDGYTRNEGWRSSNSSCGFEVA